MATPQIINVGTTANSRTGDNLRTAFIKVNENFADVYATIENGVPGADGADGKSAYQIALLHGFVGTETQWLNSLNGTNGTNGLSAYQVAVANGFVGTQPQWLASLVGAQGPDGLSAYEVAVNNGFVGTESQWLLSLVGATGATGADGISAYQVAVNNGFIGSESDWLLSLVGDTGAAGIDGTDGNDGTDGLSAYQVAVNNGFVGTEPDWLASLEGPQGPPGVGFSTNGAVFITNVVPTSSGNVGSKVFSNAGNVLESCASDTQLVTVSILAFTGNTNYIPNITVNGVSATLTQTSVGIFTSNVAINLNSAVTITAVHEDGPTDTCNVTIDTPPVITSASFIGGYPGAQTELKSGDTYQLTFTADQPFIAFEIDNYGAFNAIAPTSVSSTTTHTINGVIANRGNTSQLLGAKVRVQKSTGSWSSYYLTENDGSVDGLNLVNLNNLHPTVSIGAITYPVSQGALKNSENATIVNTLSNFDTVLYDSPNGDLSITNPSTSETPKTVSRLSGSYNVSTNNFRITATRTANDASTSSQTVVKIANVAATLVVTEPASRLRSGGNDGTAVQSYTITITASQQLFSAPTLSAGAQGTFTGGGFTGSGTTWTRSFQVSDNMTKGIYTWGSIQGTNLAGIVTSTIDVSGGNNDTYTLGGFVSRTITLPAFQNSVLMNTEVTDYTKLTLSWSVKSLPNKRPVGTTATPDANSWSIDALNANPTTILILDTAATLASSSPSTITMQEGV